MSQKRSRSRTSEEKSGKINLYSLTNRVGNGSGKSEMKVYDIYVSAGITTTPYLMAFNGMAPGTAYNERLGRSIHIHALSVRVAFVPADNSQICRVTIGRYEAGSASFSGIVSNSVDNAIIPFGGALLFDKLVGFPASVNATSATYPSVVVEKTVRVDCNTVWDQSGPTVITKNHCFVILQSDSSAVVHPTAHGFARIYYTDE